MYNTECIQCVFEHSVLHTVDYTVTELIARLEIYGLQTP